MDHVAGRHPRHRKSGHGHRQQCRAECGAILAKFRALSRRLDSITLAEYLSEYAAINSELMGLTAPSDDWRRVRDAAVTELDWRLTRARTGVAMTEDEFRLASQWWDAALEGFRRVFDAKRTFWLLWP